MSKKIVFHETQPVIKKILNDGHIAYEGSQSEFKELFPYICKSFKVKSDLPKGVYTLTKVDYLFGIEDYDSAWAELDIHLKVNNSLLTYPVLITFPTTKYDKKELDELLEEFDGDPDNFYYKNRDFYRSDVIDLNKYTFKPYKDKSGKELIGINQPVLLTIKDSQDIIRQMKQLHKNQPNIFSSRQEIVVFKKGKTVQVMPKQTFDKLTPLRGIPYLNVTSEYHTLINKDKKVKVDMIKDSLLYKGHHK